MPVIVHADSNQHVPGAQEFINNKNLTRQSVSFDESLESKKEYSKRIELRESGETVYLFVGDGNEKNEEVLNWVNDVDADHYVTYRATTTSLIQKIIDDVSLETAAHVVRTGITIHGDQPMSSSASDVLFGVTTHRDLADTLTKHRGGRPPIGTAVEDGYLIKGEDYQTVRRTLQNYIDGKLLCEEAAEKLDTTIKTISKASKRRELYQLETSEQVRDEKKGRLTFYWID